MKTKNFIYFLSVCVVVLVGGIFALSGLSADRQNNQPVYADTIITGVDGTGTGTLSDPYIIGSVAMLNTNTTMRTNLANAGGTTKYFVLTATIDMSTFTYASLVLGSNAVFDGQGFGFNNLNRSLFSDVKSGAVVKNINFSGSGNITGGSIDSIGNVSTGFRGTMENVHHTAGAMSSASAVGGLVNISLNAIFTNCSNAAGVVRTGTALDANGGLIGIANGNLTIEACQNTGTISATGSCEETGGLVGKVNNATGETATVTQSRNDGIISGLRSGGIVGKKEGSDGNGVLAISQCQNSGVVSSSTYTMVGGILAWMLQGTVTIDSCVNYANLSTANVDSGIFSFRTGGNVIISHCYNDSKAYYGISQTSGGGISFGQFDTVSGGTINTNIVRTSTLGSTNFGGGIAKTDAELQDPQILNILGADFAMGTNGFPQLRCFNENVLLFDPNGGTINGSSGNLIIKAADFNDSVITSVELPGYQFLGWDTNPASINPDIPVSNYVGTDVFPQDWIALLPNQSESYYAIWEQISYQIKTGVPAGSSDYLSDQIYSLYTYNNSAYQLVPSYDLSASIGQSLYIQTGFTNVSGENFYFENWFAINKAGSWVNLGAGTIDQLTSEQRYYFVVNEDFLNNFACYDSGSGQWTISLKAVYGDTTPSTMFFDADTNAHRNWGILEIDGDPFQFNSYLSYLPADKQSVEICVQANQYYSIVGYETKLGGAVQDSVLVTPGDLNSLGQWIFTLAAQDGLEFRVIFAPQYFDISVVTKTAGGDVFDGAAVGAYINTGAPAQVSVQTGVFEGITLYSVQGYRLVNSSVQNIKIFNQISGVYDYYSAINGVIRFPSVDKSFMDKYLSVNSVTGQQEIVIIAEYYPQVYLAIGFDYGSSENLSTVDMMVRDLSGNIHVLSGGGEDTASGYFDEGSTVTIGIQLPRDVRVADISGLPADSIVNQDFTSIQFTLDDIVQIVIHFDESIYKLNLSAQDTGGVYIDGITEQFEVERNGAPYDGSGLGLNDVISVIKGTAVSPEWQFAKWEIYVSDGSDNYLYATVTGLMEDNYDLVGTDFSIYIDLMITSLSEIDIINYFNINVVAVYTHVATVDFSFDGGGTIGYNEIISGENLEGDTYSAGTQIKLVIVPDAFYKLETVDGLNEDESLENDSVTGGYYIIITADGIRSIAVHFVPEKEIITVSSTFSPTKGRIDVNLNEIELGNTVQIKLTFDIGYQYSACTINGRPASDINGVKITGGAVTFNVTSDIMEWLKDSGYEMDIHVDLALSTFAIIGIGIAAVAIPVMVALAIFFIIANKRRKADYQKALAQMKLGKARLNYSDVIKQLRDGSTSDGDNSGGQGV